MQLPTLKTSRTTRKVSSYIYKSKSRPKSPAYTRPLNVAHRSVDALSRRMQTSASRRWFSGAMHRRRDKDEIEKCKEGFLRALQLFTVRFYTPARLPAI